VNLCFSSFDVTSEQKQQQFNAIVDISSSEFKQALEQESGQTLEKIKLSLLFILNKQIITRDIFICRGFVFEFIFNLLNTIF
jgi:hypothetical protein